MNIKNIILFGLFFTAPLFVAHSMSSKNYYITKDSVLVYEEGIESRGDKVNSQACAVVDDSLKTKFYYPDELLGYCVNNTLPFKELRPFVNAGIVYANHFNTTCKIDGNDFKYPIISKTQFGFSAGVGLERKLNYRNSIFLDFRYSELFGVSNNSLKTTNPAFQFALGVNL